MLETLAQGGNLAEAIQIYRTLRLRLHEAFANAEPAPEITALYRRLRGETPHQSVVPPPQEASPAAPQNASPAPPLFSMTIVVPSA